MWRNFHLLGKVQVFVVASICAAVIAAPFAIAAASHEESALLRNFLWPHEFDPLITFCLVLMSVLPVFLAYYHLGRLGAMLSLAVSVTVWYAMSVSAVLIFVGHAVWFDAVVYMGFVLLMYLLLFMAHKKASSSHAIQQTQRKLHLISHEELR